METPGDPDGLEMDGWIKGWMCHGRGSGVRRNEKKEKQNHCQVAVSTKTVVLTNHVCHYVMHLVSYIHIFYSPLWILPITTALPYEPRLCSFFLLFPLCPQRICLRDRYAVPSHSLLCKALDTLHLWWHETKGNAPSGITTGMTAVPCLSPSLPFHPFPPT